MLFWNFSNSDTKQLVTVTSLMFQGDISWNAILGKKAKAFLGCIISEKNTYFSLQFLNFHKKLYKFRNK